MKATAIAPANIAFIKYWGKADDALRLPLNSSISMNLSEAYTTTTVEFSKDLHRGDEVTFLDALTKLSRPQQNCQPEAERVSRHLDRIRKIAGTTLFAKIVTQNSFPTGVGIASSASGFAALTVAAAAALRLKFSEKELSILARLGSGSACRSIPDGFVMWVKGNSHRGSFAYSLYPATHWDLRDIVVIVKQQKKEVGSTAGMDKVRTSPFWGRRLRGIPDRIKAVKQAIHKKDLRLLGETIEEDALNMHAVMLTQKPSLLYWNEGTVMLMKAVWNWRREGVPVYFTIDAGPNVHLICEGKDEMRVLEAVKKLEGIESVLTNKPAQGAHLVSKHLF